MACPVCGKPSPCAHEAMRSAVLVEPESVYRDSGAAHSLPRPASAMSDNEGPFPHNDQFWRQEVISRVQQHRARRRKRCDPNATMELDFPAGSQAANGPLSEVFFLPPPPVLRPEPPKIIRFPRPVLAQPVPVEQDPVEELELAEPVLDTPRILDAPEPQPEQMDLLSSFADIRLEPQAENARGNVDLPLRPAPLQQRIFAGLVDASVVLIASIIFAIAFMTMAKGLPQTRMMLLCAGMICATLWLVYQYLFLVYSTGTPGMQMAQLELCTFKGESVSISLRRWRALASMLSGCSLGLGFAWAFVDEDTLGWHDRITQTHLRSSNWQIANSK